MRAACLRHRRAVGSSAQRRVSIVGMASPRRSPSSASVVSCVLRGHARSTIHGVLSMDAMGLLKPVVGVALIIGGGGSSGDVRADIPRGQMMDGRLLQQLEECCRPGCANRANTRGLCKTHYSRFLRGTLETDSAPIRKFAKAGQGHVGSDGYRYVSRRATRERSRDGCH
jgi:hypothetical protein